MALKAVPKIRPNTLVIWGDDIGVHNLSSYNHGIMGYRTPNIDRADPYERAANESAMYIRWYADNMWLFVPVQEKIKAFFADFEKYPYQAGTSLNAAGINYQTVKMSEALKRLGKIEEFALAARN